MTYTGTERLVRRISEALKSPEMSPNLSPLAQEYAEACRLVQLRLEQCGALLNEGNELQAVQLAEVDPPVLELIRLLGFREAPEWSNYCQENKLPVAVLFDTKIINRLNQAYSRGITPDHPLIRDYREAVLRRQDIPAMNALRSILRLNPSDKNAQGELERLEKKILGQKLEALSAAIASGSGESVTNQVDEIEALNFKSKPSGPVYTEGLRLRTEFLRDCALADAKSILTQIEPLQIANKWEAAKPMVDRIQFLKSEHSFEFPSQDEPKWKNAKDWLSSRLAENKRDQDFSRACRDLLVSVEQCDDRQAAQKQMTMAQLRADLELLVKKYRVVTEFGLKIPPEIDARYRKRYGILKAQVAKGQKNRLSMISAACGIAVILCIAAGYIVHNQQEASSLVDQMAKLRAGREVLAAEAFLKDLPTNSGRYLSMPQVSAAKAETESFISDEESRKTKFDQGMNSLNSIADKQFQVPAPEIVQKQFTDAQELQKQLCQDFQSNADAQLLAFQNRWEAFLLNEHDIRVKQVSAKLDELEQFAKNQLEFNRKPEDLAQVVAKLNDELTALSPQISTTISQLKLSDDLVARFSDLQAKVGVFQQELTTFSQDMANARAASSLDSYLQALQSLGKSQLAGATAVVDAKRILDLAPSIDKLTAGLMMPDNSDAWAFLCANPKAPFYPTSAVLDPEKSIYDQVVADPNLHQVFRYTIKDHVDNLSTIYVQGELTGDIDGYTLTTKELTDYSPLQSPDKLVFNQESLSGAFSALGETSESQAFRNCHFSTLIDDSGSKFNSGPVDAPIHELLDAVARDPKTSPLFKAYMFYNVGQLIEAGKREMFWGLQYTPALKQAMDQINRIGPPGSGDWMVPNISKSSSKQWSDLFSRLSKISYLKQAETLRAIYLRVNQTGFDYVGFIDDKGSPQLLQGPGAVNQLWGWDSATGQPGLVSTYSVESQKYVPVGQLTPMTPVFQFKGDPQAILQVVRQDQGLTDEEYKNDIEPFLPSFFKAKAPSVTANPTAP